MTRARRWASLVALATSGCARPGEPAPPPEGEPPRATAAGAVHGPHLDEATADAGPPPAPPAPGMIYVPSGAFVAGTPEGRVPRMPEAELPGVRVTLGAFFIDAYPYPNEPGAIPKTGVTQAEAAVLCAERGKRLCSELEWERACKGPQSSAYAYGDVYRAGTCRTGAAARRAPSGLAPGCASAFGVHDLHGGPWEWTSSAWGRGTTGLATLRGGDGSPGEQFARCANGVGRAPSTRSAEIGVRCCAGDPNALDVDLPLVRGAPLAQRRLAPSEAQAVGRALARLPDAGALAASTRIDRVWVWHPVANEELRIAGGCAPDGDHAACGVVLFRARGDEPEVLAWVPSAWWAPSVHKDRDARVVWVHGGDVGGAFRRRIAYQAGTLDTGERERRRGDAGAEDDAGE